jgi:tetratricopeptide (TPR) repeat protein
LARVSYLDFDLLIDQSRAGYRAQVLSAPPGIERATCDFVLPFDEKDIKILLLSIGQPRRGGTRRIESTYTEEAKKFGGRLFDAVFTKDMWACLRRSLEVAQAEGAGLRIRLQLTRDAQALADLPWEYLYDSELNRFLALSADTPVTRYLALPEPVRPLTIQPPLKVLVMISSPSDYLPLDVEREWTILQDALHDLSRDGLVVAERLEKATLPHLQRRLRRGEYHIFHFIGHGAFDEGTQDGVLLLEDDAGRGRAVSGQDLGTLLHDHRSLRLAIINACEGARSSQSDPFAGTAQSLVQQGIPGVIAMQFEISDDAAIAFSHEFYGALADGFPMDAALAEARKAIYAAVPDVEWGTPVLFMRAPDGRVFDLGQQSRGLAPAGAAALPEQSAAVPEPKAAKRSAADPVAAPPALPRADVEALLTEALAYYYTDNWSQASPLFEQILAAQPRYPGVAEKLASARRQQALLEHYTASEQAIAAEDWQAAVDNLQALVGLDPGYRDASTLLVEARRQCDLAALYEEARRLFQAQAWQAVPRVFQKITALDPAYSDPDGLLAASRERAAAAERERQLDLLYRQALLDMDHGRLREAIAVFEQVAALSPGYRQTATLLERGRQQLQLEEKVAAEQLAAERAEAGRQRQDALAASFSVALAHFEAGRWNDAVQAFRALMATAPDYADPAHGPAVDLLAKAQEMRQLAALPKIAPRGPRNAAPGAPETGKGGQTGEGGAQPLQHIDRPKPKSLPK